MAIYLQINKQERIKIEPTIFPDKTSQVWKVPGIEDIKDGDNIYVYWVFEQESELIWLCQLLSLLERLTINFIIPYWPYARQDKDVSNNSCFSTETFQFILDWFLTCKSKIHVLDAHSEESYDAISCKVINHIPYDAIYDALIQSKPDIVLFPDEGALKRYSKVKEEVSAHCIKKRNQLTGEIESIELPEVDFKDKHILIIDDICDGGGTFVEIAQRLMAAGATYIELFVSHGIFSKGKDVLYKAGISRIYTANYEEFYKKVINGWTYL